jgi:hypothetical protein
MMKFNMLKKTMITLSAASFLAIAATMALPSSAAFAAAIEAQVENGLPFPKQNTMQSTEQTPFVVTSQATVAASAEDVVAFYRAELAKLNWQEDTSKTVLTSEGAALQFNSPEGPAQLTLVSTGNAINIKLSLRKQEQAKKSGLLPAEGQTKVMFGNFMDSEAVVNINARSIKVGAHAGESGTDGPTVDLEPGTYSYTVTTPGQTAKAAELIVGTNEIWGVMIDPDGMMPMQMY